jgi:PAS domain S-box-containing protein
MKQPLKILLLEDSLTDAEIVERLLKKQDSPFTCRLSVDKTSFLKELTAFQPDLVLADNALPQFDATQALELVQQYQPHTAFILVTGTVSEEFAAGIIKKGADDYVLKDRLARLPAAIEAALKYRRIEKEKTIAADQLRESEEKYRTLVEHAFDGILIYSLDGSILDCNRSTCSFLGYTLEELKELKITALFFKEDLLNHPLYFDTLKSGATTLDHRSLKRKDGTLIEMEIGTKMMPDGRLMAIGRDITERKKAAEQQALFAAIVNSSDDAIISKTTEGIITSWNRGAACLFGYRPEEVIGKNIALIVPPDLMDEDKMILAKIKKGDFVQHYETQRIKKDGTRVFVSLTVSPVKNSRGIVIGASKIARDITEKKEAEQKIIQSEENLKAIFDNSIEGFILTDADGIVKTFNYRAEKSIFDIFSRKIEPGHSIFEFTEKYRQEYFKNVFTAVLQGQTIQYDRHYTDITGKISWINFTFTPVRHNKVIAGVCITANDITDKKIAEQQKEFDHNNLHALINNTTDLIWSVDREYKLITFNKACENFSLQLTGKILRPGVDLFDFEFGNQVAERYKTYYRRAFNGEVFTECNHYLQPVEYWSENSFYPIYEGDTVVGTACISRDITERKKN